jgi:hypothetical protein
MISEPELANIVATILASRAGRRATFHELFQAVPQYVTLSVADCAMSVCRPAERLWEVRLRNIAAHAKPDGSTCHPRIARMEGGLRPRWGNASS